MSNDHLASERRSILLIEDDLALRERLAAILTSSFRVVNVSDVARVRDLRLGRVDAVVIVLGPSQCEGDTLDRLGLLTRSRSGLGTLLVINNAGGSVLRPALRAGVDDAVELSRVEVELAAAVEELWQRLEHETAAAAADGLAPARRAQVTTVFSPKGGVGKSVVSVNLAVAFASRSDRPVAILDLDLQFGDVAVMLRLRPDHTILEAAASGDQLDAVLLRNLLSRHEPSGVLVLAAPTTPSGADQIHPRGMLQILGLLREMCSHVVIDTPPHLDEVILQAVSESDDVAFVVSMDVPSVKNSRLGLQALERIEFSRDRIFLILNRVDSKVNLSVKDVERALHLTADLTLPSEILVPQSVNEGNPAVLAFPRSQFSTGIGEIADRLIERADVRKSDSLS